MGTEPHQTMRVWKKTHKLLRMIAAQTDESMVEVLHRLAQAEYNRLRVGNTTRREDEGRQDL